MKKYSLRNHNTFGLNVFADRFIEYDSEAELLRLIEEGEIISPYLHIGRGSNLLFTKDYEGTILHSRIKDITLLSEDGDSVCLRVGAGNVWDEFVCYCVEHGWQGVENLSLIPGEVGAAAVQNIGAYGMEVKDSIISVETVDISGRRKTYAVEECDYSYRHSLFKTAGMNSVFVTYVNFRLKKSSHYVLDYAALAKALASRCNITLCDIREAVIRIRQSKLPDPKVLGNAGSFFMNPIVSRSYFEDLQRVYPAIPYYDIDADHVKIPAAWLIEQCGWKGKSLGHAAVYENQPLVLVNQGGAVGADIVRLGQAVQKSVKEKFGIDIQPEVMYI